MQLVVFVRRKIHLEKELVLSANHYTIICARRQLSLQTKEETIDFLKPTVRLIVLHLLHRLHNMGTIYLMELTSSHYDIHKLY